ncbi:MAG: ABC transporter substrate-binding protein [Actinobacteria bacterium]|nr:ABC transporter substrate-binding protein [Actinomycetota bacterium]
MGKRNEWAPNLDPIQETVESMGLDLIEQELLRGKQDPQTQVFSLVPGLAESWDQPDSKTVIFHLRKGVVFQDGSPFNAQVVKWNLDRMVNNPKSAAKTDLLTLKSVDVVDDYTVRLNLNAPPTALLFNLSDLMPQNREAIVSKDAVDKNGEDYLARHPVGAGPFQFVEWKTGDSMTVKKFDKYWEMGEDGQPLPYLDSIVFHWVADKTVKAVQIRTGNLDIVDEIDAQDIPAVKAVPNLQFMEYPWSAQVQYMFFNMTKPPFGDNLKLRQASLYAIDYQSIAKTVGLNAGYPAYYFWGKGVLGYDETLPRYDYQPDKAKQLIKDAGFPNGIDVDASLIAREPDNRTAQVIKSMWDAVGFRTILDPIERTAVVAKWQNGDFQVGLSGRGWGEIDPDNYSFRLTTEGPFNFAHWSDPGMDSCMKEGREATDPNQRAQIYKKCQNIIYEQAPYGQSWYFTKNITVNNKVKGWLTNYLEAVRLTYAWLDK